VSALLCFLIMGLAFLGLLFSENQQWYALGRAYLNVSQLFEEDSKVKGGSAHFSFSLTYEKESLQGKGSFYFERPESFRLELDSSAGAYSIVNNGSTWIHFKDRNAVLVADENLSPEEAVLWLPRFVLTGAEAVRDEMGEKIGLGTDKSRLDLTSFVEAQVPEAAEYEVNYGGRDTIGDTERCFKIQMESKDPEADFTSASVWIDPATWLPRKITMDGVVRGTVELFQVSLGPVEKGTFDFTIPDGSQIQTIPRETLLQFRQWMGSKGDI